MLIQMWLTIGYVSDEPIQLFTTRSATNSRVNLNFVTPIPPSDFISQIMSNLALCRQSASSLSLSPHKIRIRNQNQSQSTIRSRLPESFEVITPSSPLSEPVDTAHTTYDEITMASAQRVLGNLKDMMSKAEANFSQVSIMQEQQAARIIEKEKLLLFLRCESECLDDEVKSLIEELNSVESQVMALKTKSLRCK